MDVRYLLKRLEQKNAVFYHSQSPLNYLNTSKQGACDQLCEYVYHNSSNAHEVVSLGILDLLVSMCTPDNQDIQKDSAFRCLVEIAFICQSSRPPMAANEVLIDSICFGLASQNPNLQQRAAILGVNISAYYGKGIPRPDVLFTRLLPIFARFVRLSNSRGLR